ncbi:VOC family protein [Marinovum sp.]|uniref:VOC family protein n=1 Tax=Marinovum sp. TaxID=2024839 RepID=UPI002B26E319|nr:VOC family protein [Marinovum sp.]
MTRAFPITAIASVDIQSPDPERHAAFYRDVWGLEPIDHPGDARFFAGTGADPYILALVPGESPGLAAVTFRCASAEAMDQTLARAEKAGCRRIDSPAPATRPGGGTMVDFREPNGCVIRLVHGDQPRDPKPTRIDRATRLSHVNINTRDVDALARFYEDVLGFALTDRSKIMAFLRCNADHHAVVLAEAPVEGLNHIAFMLPELEGVMRASGRMRDHGYDFGWGVGRHGPGNNVFAYFVDPEGYVVEHTAEVLQVDDSYEVGGPADWTWPPGRTDHWGIAPPKSETCKAAQTAIGFV